jgi:hypothetical protein
MSSWQKFGVAIAIDSARFLSQASGMASRSWSALRTHRPYSFSTASPPDKSRNRRMRKSSILIGKCSTRPANVVSSCHSLSC